MRKQSITLIVVSLLLTSCARIAAPASPLKTISGPTPTARVLARAAGPGSQQAAMLERASGPGPITTVDPNHAAAIQALPKVGQLAPDFTLQTLSGTTVRLSQWRGRPVIINFWATWCVACRAESTLLERTYQQKATQGLVVLGVNVTQEDTLASVQNYVTTSALTFPIALDSHGAVTDAYHVPGLPVTFFVDAQGIIRNVIVGQMHNVDLFEGLKLIGV